MKLMAKEKEFLEIAYKTICLDMFTAQIIYYIWYVHGGKYKTLLGTWTYT